MHSRTQDEIPFHTVLSALWIVCYIALSSLDLSFMGDMLEGDSRYILKIAEHPGLSSTTDGSYYYTGVFFGLFPSFLIQPFIILIGSVALWMFLRPARNLFSFSLACFLSLPPIILFLSRPQKETLVLLLTMAIVTLFRAKCSVIWKCLGCIALYAIYAYFFRIYFILMVMVFIGILVFIHLPAPGKLMCLLAVPLAFILIPDAFLIQLQAPRDDINFRRLALNLPGSRSAFANLLPPTDTFSFLINYVYAFFRLHVPILFALGLKELWMTATVGAYGFLLKRGFSSSDNTTSLCLLLFISHALILTLFEPDLGSYLRHLSSAFLYLIPALEVISGRAEQGIKDRVSRMQKQHA